METARRGPRHQPLLRAGPPPPRGPAGAQLCPTPPGASVSSPAGWARSLSGSTAPTYPSGSAVPPSSAPSAWPPAAPPTGTAPPWGWAGRWLRSGRAGPARSPPGPVTGLGPGPPACSLQPRPPRPPACPRPRPRSSHLAYRKRGVRASRGLRRPPPLAGAPAWLLAPHQLGGGSPHGPVPHLCEPKPWASGRPRVGSGFGDQSGFLSGGTATCTCAVGRTRTGLQTALHGLTRTHTPREGSGRRQERREDSGGRGSEGGGGRSGPGGSGWVSRHRHLALLAAGGLGAGGRRRWTLVPSWG